MNCIGRVWSCTIDFADLQTGQRVYPIVYAGNARNRVELPDALLLRFTDSPQARIRVFFRYLALPAAVHGRIQFSTGHPGRALNAAASAESRPRGTP